MPKIRVNYKSDLPPVAVKFKINGNIVDVPDHDFIIRFFVDGSPGTSFECIHKGDEYINCAKTAADTLTCYIDNHKFGCGRLCCEFIDLSADSRYGDKVFKTVTPSCLDVVLVDGVGDDNIEVLTIIFGYEINEIANITAEESEEDGGTNVITITETNGEAFSFNVKNGNKGNGIDTITTSESSASGGSIVITITETDGTETEFTVKNGLNGVVLEGDPATLIADNLTTNDGDKILSARQGKVIGDILDVDVDTGTVTRLLTPSEHGENVGYLSASATTGKRTPQTGSTEYRRYSDPISLKTGDVLYIKAATNDNVARLSKYVEGATYDALMILQGTLSSSDINNGITYETTYTAQEDFDALIGWNWYGDIEIKITRQEDVVTSKADMIEPMAEVLDFSSEATTETSPITLTGSNGYYRDIEASLSGTNLSTYKHSDFVSFKAGEVLTIDVKNVASSAKVLARKEGDKVRGLISGNSDTQHITYTVPYDAQYAFSWLNSTGITVTKTVTINGSSARLDALEENAASKDDVEDLEDAVYNVVTDGLTTGLVEGKYIDHNGRVATNENYAYKEIAVKAGAVINFTANEHPELAAIAKKIPHTNSYEELVPATQQAVQSFTYTATEEMIIAVSFTNMSNSIHTITISTTLPASNRLNVENIYDKIDVKHHVDFGRMFDKIAVIGDSLASGRVEGIVGQSDAVGADFYHFSWLAFLAKRWRCEAYKNYSNAGADTATWIRDWLPVLQADTTVYDAYFIALGTNNEYNESNPSGDQENYEAFIDRYNDIIDAVRTKAPHAVIFLVSLYQKRAGNAALEDIAEARMATDDGVFYLDYANNAEYFRYSPEVNWRGHFSSTGYVYVAEAINRIVNDVVWENQTKEFWHQFAKYHNNNQ